MVPMNLINVIWLVKRSLVSTFLLICVLYLTTFTLTPIRVKSKLSEATDAVDGIVRSLRSSHEGIGGGLSPSTLHNLNIACTDRGQCASGSIERWKRMQARLLKTIRGDTFCNKQKCPANSFCYLGMCVCHPGYDGQDCSQKLEVANMWYTHDCPNLLKSTTIDVNEPITAIGGEISKGKTNCRAPAKDFCAYLCYSHNSYGTAVVPVSLWQAAQKAEGDLWASLGGSAAATDANDRAVEHWEAFDNFRCLSTSHNLGRVIELGAGPWTQVKGMMHIRPDLVISEFTVWEPGAKRYMQEVASCSYRSGSRLRKWDGSGEHAFPVVVRSEGGELLARGSDGLAKALDPSQQYDTVVSINVLEHVQDAFAYINGMYAVLKPGGYLIFHDRYYDESTIIDGDMYHPVRISRAVLDRFLAGFEIVYNNCNANYAGRKGEQGYYVIARKL